MTNKPKTPKAAPGTSALVKLKEKSEAKSKPGLKILPITAEEIRDPQKFGFWLFANSPAILQEMFNTLPEASPNERLKVLAELFRTTIQYKPFLAVDAPQDGNSDPASDLARLLMETEEFEHEEEN